MDNPDLVRRYILILLSFLILASVCVLAQEEDSNRNLSIGQLFHQQTSLTWQGVLGDMFSSKPSKPPQYKTYKGSKKMGLPKPNYQGLTVEQAIERRRSVRNYSKEPISMAQLSQLLFAAQGVTEKLFGQALRSAPSAGALYPFEIYIVVNSVEDLPQGIYHYSVLDHTLELLKEGDFRSKITLAGLDQDMLGKSGVTFVFSAVFDRTRYKYGERGFRYVYIEAGHISQNISLEAVSLGLGSVCVGAFLDEKVNKLIDIDGQDEAVIYLHAVGCL